jgi:hypothetical protein
MKKWIPIVTAVLVTIVMAGTAVATHILPSFHVSRASLDEAIAVNADSIKFQTKAPTDVRVATLTFHDGQTTGWHRHPGVVIIAVTEGEMTLYRSDCSSRTYSPNEVFVESGEDAAVFGRAAASGTTKVVATFIVPDEAPFSESVGSPCPGIS